MPEPTIEQLQAQIAALQKQLAATQSGSGGQAVGQDNVVSGAGGVSVGRDFIGNIYQGEPPKDEKQAIAIYRRMLVLSCRQLPLRGVHVGASDPTSNEKQLDLDQVYVNLDTTKQVSRDELMEWDWDKPVPRSSTHRPPPMDESGFVGSRERREHTVTALEAVAQNRRVVLLGDPGSGKSTFVNHLGLCLALHGSEPANHWCDRLAGWPQSEATLLPVPVILRDFARTIPAKPVPADASTLWDFITDGLKKQRLAAVAGPLEQAIEAGQAVVLLDGLDEIATPAHRKFVREAVLKFIERYSRSRFLVTCRTLSYQDAAWKLRYKDDGGKEHDFPAFTLAPFDEPKIDQFIAAWFGDLKRLGVVKPDDAAPLTRGLQTALRRPDLWQLASNPLLLTVMALVHTHKGRLPDARALLYEDTVDILLWRWEQLKLASETETPGLRQLLVETGRSDVDLKRTLWRMAYEAHRAGGHEERLADIGELALQTALAELHPDKSHDWARKIIETIKHRAGLLLERLPQVYTFPHRTFQEYLAGAHLASQASFAKESAKLVEAGAFWREVILLAVGKLVYLHGDNDKPLALVGELCPQHEAATLLGWQQVWLAGEALCEMGLPRVRESVLGCDLLERVQGHLVKLLEIGALTPVERAKAGIALGKLGDSRHGVGLKSGLPEMDWLEVQPGAFIMGSKQGEPSYDAEAPQFECRLITQSYRISRYPVTVAQYKAFVDAGGYADAAREWWTNEGWKWKQKNKVSGPDDYALAFQTPNHPSVGVSWFEAVAFCRWLSEQTHRDIRLPSEAEWERAARHTDARKYPWGNEDNCAQRCNMVETGIGSTCAVGIFPNGISVCGAADMAGNIWEWCRTKWTGNYKGYEKAVDDDSEGDDARVLRGGSFGDVPVVLRCGLRDYFRPDGRDVSFGFRVVCVGASAR